MPSASDIKPGVNQNTASELIEEIRKKAESEANSELKHAREENGAILKKAGREAGQIESDLIEKAGQKAEQARRRIISGVELQKKRAFLDARESLVESVREQVRERLEKYRNSEDYTDTLIRWIIEGSLAIGSEKIKLHVAPPEKKLLGHLETITEQLKREGVAASLELVEAETDEGGVFLSSADGRITYDNRFSARLKREEREIRERVNAAIGTRKGY